MMGRKLCFCRGIPLDKMDKIKIVGQWCLKWLTSRHSKLGFLFMAISVFTKILSYLIPCYFAFLSLFCFIGFQIASAGVDCTAMNGGGVVQQMHSS